MYCMNLSKRVRFEQGKRYLLLLLLLSWLSFIALLNWRRWNLERQPYIIITTLHNAVQLNITNNNNNNDTNEEKKTDSKRIILFLISHTKIMIDTYCVKRNGIPDLIDSIVSSYTLDLIWKWNKNWRCFDNATFNLCKTQNIHGQCTHTHTHRHSQAYNSFQVREASSIKILTLDDSIIIVIAYLWSDFFSSSGVQFLINSSE